jgi:hypothetical protein
MVRRRKAVLAETSHPRQSDLNRCINRSRSSRTHSTFSRVSAGDAPNLTLGPLIREWHFILRNAVFNAAVVTLLACVVIPIVRRLLHSLAAT